MKKVIILLIGVLMFFNVYMIYNKNTDVKDYDKMQNDITFAFENKFIVEQENNSLKLNKEMFFLTIEGDSITAKEVFKKKNIVFRYSFLNCGACINAELEVLSKFSKVILEKLVIVAHYERVRDLIGVHKKLKTLDLQGVPVFLIQNNELGIPMDQQNLPYYFLIDSKLNMDNFFIPLKEEPKLSQYYLNFNIQNYFN